MASAKPPSTASRLATCPRQSQHTRSTRSVHIIRRMPTISKPIRRFRRCSGDYRSSLCASGAPGVSSPREPPLWLGIMISWRRSAKWPVRSGRSRKLTTGCGPGRRLPQWTGCFPRDARRRWTSRRERGLFTRALLGRVPDITAVEPDGRMRAVLAERTEGVRVLDGRGEAIPLPDASVDAVFVSTAWHWFDPALAIPEIARVLRDGGRLGVIWTSRNRADDWVAELDLLRLSAVAGEARDWEAGEPRTADSGAREAGPSSLGNPAAGRALHTRGGRVVHVHPDHGRRRRGRLAGHEQRVDHGLARRQGSGADAVPGGPARASHR